MNSEILGVLTPYKISYSLLKEAGNCYASYLRLVVLGLVGSSLDIETYSVSNKI